MMIDPIRRPSKEILISEDRIQARVSDLAREISSDYAGSQVVLLAVLRGAVMFASDLLRKLDPALAPMLDFVTASSYGDGTVSSGKVRLLTNFDSSVEGRNVLIVEDIVETGRTVEHIRNRVASAGALSVRTVTLLHKESESGERPKLDYVGFSVPNLFVVGYGLDFAQRYRNLTDIRVLDD